MFIDDGMAATDSATAELATTAAISIGGGSGSSTGQQSSPGHERLKARFKHGAVFVDGHTVNLLMLQGFGAVSGTLF
jgi:hypothetical protein